MARSVLGLAIVPILVIVPFLIWNAEAFVTSVFISVTRNPVVIGNAYSLDVLIGLVGFPGKIPMLLLVLLVYWASFKHLIGKATAVLLIHLAFVGFNSVYFPSYFVWVIPFIPLSIYEHIQQYSTA
jgi:hypothetical protein